MSRKATPNIDYTSRDYEAYRAMMIAQLRKKMPEYTDLSQSDAGIVILECLANGLDICSLYTDVMANDVILATTQDRATACVLARDLGYTPYNQTASITKQIFRLTSTRLVDTVIPKGTKVATKAENGVQLVFETLEDLTIPAGNDGYEPLSVDAEGNITEYKYCVDVINATSVSGDKLGISDRTAYQKFTCTYPRVLVDAQGSYGGLEVWVHEGSDTDPVKWERVDSFFDSDIDQDSKVYTVTVDDFDVCTIEFGDGVHGKVPDGGNSTSNDKGIYANYKIGGGLSGNVNKETITVMKTSVAYIDSTKNPFASYVLGRDKESLEEIRYNAPAAFRVRDRAVTLQDYEDLIKINSDKFYGIYNTRAIRNEDDHLECDMFFQMREETLNDGSKVRYALDTDLMTELEKFFADREMIGAHHTFSVSGINDEQQQQNVTVVNLVLRLYVDNDYNQEEVKTNVEKYIREVFFAFGEFTFGDEFVKTDLEAEILNNVAGVRSLRIVNPETDIILAEHKYDIIVLGSVDLTQTYGGIGA